MKLILFLFLIMTRSSATAQNNLNIIPMPTEVKMGKGNFMLSPSTKIILQGSNLEKIAVLINNYLKNNYGFSLKIQTNASAQNAIILNYGRMENLIADAYTLDIDQKKIYISGGDEAGVFYGIQTLFQLLPAKKNLQLSVPQLYIKDYPRFAYRGMHLDVGRHFFSVSFIKKYIDFLAAFKFNTFHWHLTEDQGWRIEIKKYPLLTQVGGYRNGTIIGPYPGKGNDSIYYGGFYTQSQIKEIVKYAADRYIDVVPEIEMPGHSSAAIAAYPQLSCFPDEDTQHPSKCTWAGSTKGKQVQQTWGVFNDVFAPTEYTFKFLEDVIDEVIQLFPSKYIHIGGDECPKENWKRSLFCQQLIKEKNLKDEHGLQSYFIQRIEKYINSKGKKIIGWDEILEGGLAPNATVMSWRGEEGGIAAAIQNHDVIMTPGTYCYLDHSQSKNEDSVTIGGYLPLEKVYSFDPIPALLNTQQQKHILGAQGNVWTEYMSNEKKVEYMIFPRMSALAEVLWSPKQKRNWKDFERRIPIFLQRLDKQKINYSNAYVDLKATILPTENFEGIKILLESKLPDSDIRYRYNVSKFYTYRKPVELTKSVELSFSIFKNEKPLNINTLKFSFSKATGKKITLANEPSKNYPGDGAFTLVNGVQNEKGLANPSEFLGFLGKDLDATIDLGSVMNIKKITLHVLQQSESWIYLPKKVEVTYLYSVDTGRTALLGPPEKISSVDVQQQDGINRIEIPGEQTCRYIRVLAKNFGIIPSGNPGAGSAAWLFADEIEVE